MYIVLATYSEIVHNPYYVPGCGHIEPETIKQDVVRTFELKTVEDLTSFVQHRAKDYHTVKYYKAEEVFPKLVQTVNLVIE